MSSSILKAMLCASAGLGSVFHNTATFARAEQSSSDDETLSIIELDENLADVEKPSELPPGVYTAEVQDVQVNDSQKGNRYFAIKFIVPPEEIPADVRDDFPDGAVLFWNRNIVPTGRDRRALFNLRQLIEKLGLDAATNQVDPNEWMGRSARIRVVMGKWQGEERAEIRAIEAAEKAPAARGKGPARGRQEPEGEAEGEAETAQRRPTRARAGARR